MRLRLFFNCRKFIVFLDQKPLKCLFNNEGVAQKSSVGSLNSESSILPLIIVKELRTLLYIDSRE